MRNLTAELPTLPDGFEYRLDLAKSTTSLELHNQPRHRWFYFPHSFSNRLVHAVLDHWGENTGATLVDNFVGSGTTLLAAREQHLHAIGYDLSPLAVCVSNAKISNHSPVHLRESLKTILTTSSQSAWHQPLPHRLTRAFSASELKVVLGIISAINKVPQELRDFYLVSLLSVTRDYSRAVPDGGWFRWKTWPDRSFRIKEQFANNTNMMITDVESTPPPTTGYKLAVDFADARKLPQEDSSAHFVIASPPYANRHDYSRIFHIELLLLGVTESKVTQFRHQSIRSHIEAKSPIEIPTSIAHYQPPSLLKSVLAKFPADADTRVKRFLKGYFEDMYLSLHEATRILRPGGRLAYVLGNVRHAGIMIPVDELLVYISEQVGLVLDTVWVTRLRGNSAQQMGKFGREPARESIILLRKKDNV